MQSTPRPGLLAAALAASFFSCAKPAQFQGATNLASTDPVSQGETVPYVPPPLPPCKDESRAIRIALVVDNTGSNSCLSKDNPGVDPINIPNGIQDPNKGLCGTDPVRAGGPPLANGRGFTQRQNAIYETVLRIIDMDAKARESNPAFQGSEIGLSSFPFDRTLDGLGKSVFHSGQGNVFPQLMTNTKDMQPTEEFKNNLWALLHFTHMPQGMTPYATGIEGGKHLLSTGRSPTESRPELVLFITDGLPTDQQPSRVKAAKDALGPDVPLIVLSVFEKGKDVEKQNAPAKASLKGYWDSSDFLWGHNPAGNDGFPDFEAYWRALTGTPKAVATQYIEIQGAENLQSALDKVLGAFKSCDKAANAEPAAPVLK